ncbi:hypothetical protein BCM43_28430 (plasmid) [Bacillus thuringiensis]|uniref:hypothetical protein n=1 Tax=Bacillus thuringiensis TaxID=1428 RepID=UPI00080F5AA4|nr:hypothetical protein [Bacillus thuringiensis]ANV74379.1 hypothetical protein BCM43_28430 [Bacillus thuringiensis]
MGYITPFRALGRTVLQGRYKPSYKQVKSKISRLIKNPRKQIKRSPGVRLEGIAKARKKGKQHLKILQKQN